MASAVTVTRGSAETEVAKHHDLNDDAQAVTIDETEGDNPWFEHWFL